VGVVKSSSELFADTYSDVEDCFILILHLVLQGLINGELIAYAETSDVNLLYQVPTDTWRGNGVYRVFELQAAKFDPVGLEPHRLLDIHPKVHGQNFGIYRTSALKWLTRLRAEHRKFAYVSIERATDSEIIEALQRCSRDDLALGNATLRPKLVERIGKPIGKERFRNLRVQAGLSLPVTRPKKQKNV
jgi:hypothetical protein